VVTHYGFYSTIVGIGILVGNLAVGWLMSVAHRLHADEMLWGGMILVGTVTILRLHRLEGGSVRRASSIVDAVPAPSLNEWLDRSAGCIFACVLIRPR
jgi:hypothetical protein